MTSDQNVITIQLRGIRVFAFHGVLPVERQFGQTFLVDVDLVVPHPKDDHLDSTADYAQAVSVVHEVMTGSTHQLIETVAVQLADKLHSLGYVLSVQVTVHKPQAPIGRPVADVAVVVSRP